MGGPSAETKTLSSLLSREPRPRSSPHGVSGDQYNPNPCRLVIFFDHNVLMGEPVVKLSDLPMADDRTEPYAMLREAGPLVQFDGGYLVTNRELSEYVL